MKSLYLTFMVLLSTSAHANMTCEVDGFFKLPGNKVVLAANASIFVLVNQLPFSGNAIRIKPSWEHDEQVQFVEHLLQTCRSEINKDHGCVKVNIGKYFYFPHQNGFFKTHFATLEACNALAVAQFTQNEQNLILDAKLKEESAQREADEAAVEAEQKRFEATGFPVDFP